jgi:hypothetical protein
LLNIAIALFEKGENMTIGEIKIQALKLMFVSYSDDLSPENLIDLEGQENYRPYLVNMNGAIDRCISDIERRCVVPTKTMDLIPQEESAEGYQTRIEITAPDFYEIERISKESLYEYDGEHPFDREGNTILLADFDKNAIYRMLYYPRIKRTATQNDIEQIDLPEDIAAVVAYYVKGDLFREDEPNEASEARNWYESAMQMIQKPRISKINKVRSVYSQVW